MAIPAGQIQRNLAPAFDQVGVGGIGVAGIVGIGGISGRVPFNGHLSITPSGQCRSKPGTSPSVLRPWWPHHKHPGRNPIRFSDESARRVSRIASATSGVSSCGISVHDEPHRRGIGIRHPPGHDPEVCSMESGPGQSPHPNHRWTYTGPPIITRTSPSGSESCRQ
jgi:hypothetical protein